MAVTAKRPKSVSKSMVTSVAGAALFFFEALGTPPAGRSLLMEDYGVPGINPVTGSCLGITGRGCGTSRLSSVYTDDQSRPVATSPDGDFTVSIDEAVERYARPRER